MRLSPVTLCLVAVALNLSATAAKPCQTPIETEPLLRIGIFADCQYGDKEDSDERSYRGSKERLRRAVDYFNEQKVAFTISLGDIVENDPTVIDELLPFLNKMDSVTYHLLGNHDFYADTAASHSLHRAIGVTKPYYYSVERDHVRLIMLNTNTRTYYAADNDSLRIDAAAYADSLTAAGIKVYNFNGSVDAEQMAWVEAELKASMAKNQLAILFSHHPLRFFLPNVVAQNSSEVCALIDRYTDVVVAHIAGHLHYGGRTLNKGIHYLIMKGMVQKETANFASVLSIFSDRMAIRSIDGSKFTLKYRNQSTK